MSRFFRVIRKVFLTITGTGLMVLILLYSYYRVEENRLEQQYLLLEKNSQVTVIQADTILTGVPGRIIPVLPLPQQYKFTGGYFTLPTQITFTADTLADSIQYYLTRTAEFEAAYNAKKAQFHFRFSDSIPDEGYRLTIADNNISIAFGHVTGLHYALVTLRILSQAYKGNIPCLEINDYPDLAVRGIILNLSHGKVPKLTTLMDIVQKMADLKYNHLELCFNGPTYAYASFQRFWEGRETPLTGNEISILDTFCQARFIHLVPAMYVPESISDWYMQQRDDATAIIPECFLIPLHKEVNSNIGINDSTEIELIDRLAGDLLPNFNADMYSVANDHPETNIVDMRRVAGKFNKQLSINAGFLLENPGQAKRLPKEIILMDKGHEPDYPFEKNARILKSTGNNFILLPSTEQGASILEYTPDIMANIVSAVLNAIKYDAEGILLNDEHYGPGRYITQNYAAYATAAAISWNSKSMNTFPLPAFLNNDIFMDTRSIMADLALDLGRYRKFEEFLLPDMGTTGFVLRTGLTDKLLFHALMMQTREAWTQDMKVIAPGMVEVYHERYENRLPFDHVGMTNFLDEKEAQINNTNLLIPDGETITSEYRNTILLIRTSHQLQYFNEYRDNMSIENQLIQLENIKSGLLHFIKQDSVLWNVRNKPGGYERNVAVLKRLLQQVNGEIALAEKPVIIQRFTQFGEKITSSAKVLYLRFF